VQQNLGAVLGIQALRAALYGFGAVLLGDLLALRGFSPAAAGLILTAMVAGMATSSLAVGALGSRVSRRVLYVGLLLLMGVAGLVFSITASLPALLVAGLTGTLSTDPNESGPITTVEQSLIGGAEAPRRLRLFGRYNAIAYLAGAVGSLAAAGAGDLRRSGLVTLSTPALFAAFPLVAIVCVALALQVRSTGGGNEPGAAAPSLAGPSSRPSRRIVLLSSLFAVDAFGGGFVTQAFIAFWLRIRFGATADVVGVVFFITGVLQAVSSIVAAWLAARIGVLNVMVFTHLPSNLLLAAIAFAPSLGAASALLVARFALSQMDVPARQAFVVGMVPPSERLGAAAYTNLSRYVARPLGPGLAGVMMRVAFGAPFLVAGGVKVIYDGLLYLTFRSQELYS